MRNDRAFVPLGVVAVLLTVSSLPALAATPAFTIVATNVTMSSNTSSGTGTTSFTLTSVNGYTGSVGVNCNAPNPPAGVTVPICDFGGPAYAPYTLTANQTITGTITFANSLPACNPCPVSLPRSRGHKLPATLALAGAILFAFGFRRRASRWLTLTLFALGSLAGLVGTSACGGNKTVVTPGTYAYTISAVDLTTFANVSTSVQVTVP